MPETVKPFIQITEPEPLVVFDRAPHQVEVMVQAKALGPCQVYLRIHADECAFRVGNILARQVRYVFECQNVFQSTVLQLPFTVVCTHPSAEDILFTFTAQATNSGGGTSMVTPAFNVDLKPAQATAEALPSELLAAGIAEEVILAEAENDEAVPDTEPEEETS